MSAVDFYKVQTRLQRDDVSMREAVKLLAGLELTVMPFEEAHAVSASELYAKTKALGLPLGDRTCLALGLRGGRDGLDSGQGMEAVEDWRGDSTGSGMKMMTSPGMQPRFLRLALLAQDEISLRSV